jgi:cysteine-rich repeat protein
MRCVCLVVLVVFAGCFKKNNPEFCCATPESCASLGVSEPRDCVDGFTCADDIHTCVAVGCGNGVLDPAETCDDGNNANDDGCSGNCLEATCFVPVTHRSIQAAVDDPSCAAISAFSGTYGENLTIGRDLVVRGVGLDPVVIDGSGAGTVITIMSGSVALEHITVRNGMAAQGGGVLNRGATTLRDVRVEANTAIATVGAGGGIYNDGGSLTLEQSVVTGNHAATNGTAMSSPGAAGAGIFSTSGAIAINGGSIDANEIRMMGIAGVFAQGAGIAIQSGELTLSGTTIASNVIDIDGHPDAGIAEVGRGAGVFVESGTLHSTSSTIRDSTLSMKGDRPFAVGGGVYAPAALLTDTTIDNNSIEMLGDEGAAARGAGLYLAGTADSTISTCKLTRNVINASSAVEAGEGFHGGGVALEGSGSLTIVNCDISANVVTGLGNELEGEGGGISWRPSDTSTSGTVSVSNTTIAGNIVRVMVCKGGGIGSLINTGQHEIVISQSAITGNQLIGQFAVGAGVQSKRLGSAGRVDIAIEDSTISGNVIQSTQGLFEGVALGAGVGMEAQVTGTSATLSVDSSTITGNNADGIVDAAGGLALVNATAFLRDSIIAKNTSPFSTTADCQLKSGSSGTRGHNLLGSATCVNTGNAGGDLIGVDPKLGPLGDNGGPTPTHALLDGSPALDAGDPLGCIDFNQVLLAEDQRGSPRMSNFRCDIGAFER